MIAATEWKPLPGAQFQFLTCPVFEALMHGTRGGGKTDTLLMSFAQHCGKGFGEHWRGVLFRLTYPQLADVVAKSRRWFSQFFPEAKFNKADYYWEWPTGEMLFFRYGASEDDYWNYHGHEYPWLGFEELTNWRDLSFYEAMHSTCRSSFPGMPRMVRGTCNPFGKGHGAVKERFQLGSDGVPSGTVLRLEGEKPRVAIRSTIYENKVLLANDPDYLATLEALKDPNRRKAWLEGDWDIHVGSFLEGVWDAKRHIVEPFPIPSTWKVWKSMDWGYARPYCVLWFALDPDGVHYIWRELYGIGEKPNEGIYARNPEISATPNYKSDNLKLFCKTLETVTNRCLEEAKLKARAKATVRSALTSSFGVVKVMYQRDMQQDPLIQSRINDTQDNIQEIERLIATIDDPDHLSDLESNKEQLKETMQALKEKVEVTASEGLVIDRVLTDKRSDIAKEVREIQANIRSANRNQSMTADGRERYNQEQRDKLDELRKQREALQ